MRNQKILNVKKTKKCQIKLFCKIRKSRSGGGRGIENYGYSSRAYIVSVLRWFDVTVSSLSFQMITVAIMASQYLYLSHYSAVHWFQEDHLCVKSMRPIFESFATHHKMRNMTSQYYKRKSRTCTRLKHFLDGQSIS